MPRNLPCKPMPNGEIQQRQAGSESAILISTSFPNLEKSRRVAQVPACVVALPGVLPTDVMDDGRGRSGSRSGSH
jgi:hypothetical protein